MSYNDLQVLRAFLLEDDKSFTAKELTKKTGLSETGVYWIIKGLLAQQFIVRSNGHPKRYKLNPALFKITGKKL